MTAPEGRPFTTYVWSAQEVLIAGGNVNVLGMTLYSQFLLPFEIRDAISKGSRNWLYNVMPSTFTLPPAISTSCALHTYVVK